MAIRGLNHAVLWVRDVRESTRFYTEVLGFRVVYGNDRTSFLQAPDSDNDHDLGLFETETTGDDRAADGRPPVGLYHLAWEVPTLADLRGYAERLTSAGALVGATDHGATKAIYAKDPDGLEFEICWPVPLHLVDDAVRKHNGPLDLDADIARYGADTPGEVSRVGARSSR